MNKKWRIQVVNDLLNRYADLLNMILTLYGPNSFFRRFSGHNLR